MKYAVFSGCSYTAGNGFELEKEEPCLWVNQLHNKFFSHCTKLNIGQGGASNAVIFQNTITALVEYPVEYIIVQWTSVPRYALDLGFEMYSTFMHFIPNAPCRAVNTNSINYSGEYLDSIRDRFTSLAHDCYELLNLIKYVNTIKKLSQITRTKVFFVNGLGTWDKDFFTKKIDCLPDQYSNYTQKLLNVSNRDDGEIFQLYDKMHQGFDSAGGIHENQWLNLYSSMRRSLIDFNQDLMHPGQESNNQYVTQFSKELQRLL